ncbi:hypothetical protein I315_01863 [Cryptococcus gattii Ru294]|nr:hypothetical protein I315_01863 [Cryptococcus gattii Ru294]
MPPETSNITEAIDLGSEESQTAASLTAASCSSTPATLLYIYTPKTKENSRGKAAGGKAKATGKKKASNLRQSVPRLSRQEDRSHPNLSQRAVKRRKQREIEGKGSRATNWTQDREEGGPSSQEVMVEWLKMNGNYDRYRQPPNGLRKIDIARRAAQYSASTVLAPIIQPRKLSER